MNSALLSLKEDLLKCDQKHLFTHPKSGKELPEEVQVMILKELNSLSYPGGAPGYVLTAQRLLGTLPSQIPELSSNKDKKSTPGGKKGEDEERIIADVKLPPRDVMFSFPNITDPFYADKGYEGGERARERVFPSELGKLLPESFKSEISKCSVDGNLSSLSAIEKYGLSLVKDTVLVLVAGGLGERLGYKGIKVSLPTETASHRCYLEHFIDFLATAGRGRHYTHEHEHTHEHHGEHEHTQEHQKNQKGPHHHHHHHPQNPFVIMTSSDTHSLTVQLLADNECFGYDPARIFVMQQETVPCLMDQEGHIAVNFIHGDQSNPERITGVKLPRKPHGHGDVHQLLYQLHEDNSFTMAMAMEKAVKKEAEKPISGEGLLTPLVRKGQVEEKGGEKGGKGGQRFRYENLKFDSGIHVRDVKGKRLVDKWLTEEHYNNVVFIQDTNTFSPVTIPFTLAAMKLGGREKKRAIKSGHGEPEDNGGEEFGLKMMFTCVPRREIEAVGVFCQQDWKPVNKGEEQQQQGSTTTTTTTTTTKDKAVAVTRVGNIEYNLFSEVYKRVMSSKGGSSAKLVDGEGNSIFPGSINTLLISLDAYVKVLHWREGKVPEFINPKYNPATAPDGKKTFKSPARVESLMQDIASVLCDMTTMTSSSGGGKAGNGGGGGEQSALPCVGCAVFSRDTFEPVKNLLDDGISKIEHSVNYLSSDLIKKMKDSNERKRIERITATSSACVAATGEEVYLSFLRKRFLNASKGVITDDCCTNCFVFYENNEDLKKADDKDKPIRDTSDRSATVVDERNPSVVNYDKCVCVDNSVIVCTSGKNASLPVNLFPIISFDSRFAKGLSLSALVERFGTEACEGSVKKKHGSCNFKITSRSVLVVIGEVKFEGDIEINGSVMVVNRDKGNTLVIKGLKVENKGWEAVPLDLLPPEEQKKVVELDRMRGYKLIQHETCVIREGNKQETKTGEV